MPREHKKRGKRGEKRKRVDDEEAAAAGEKRPRIQNHYGEEGYDFQLGEATEAFGDEDYIPLESGRDAGEFYGLLDEEEQAYFKRADQMLELNQFESAEQRKIFLESVWNEARGKELKLASSQSCSRLIERLLQFSNSSQLKTLFQKFSGHFLSLVQHRFASHCCEALFIRSVPIVTEELVTDRDVSTQEESESPTMEKHFLQVVSELKADIGYLMTDRFASHAVRVLLVALSGHPLDDGSKKSLLRGRSKERIHEGFLLDSKNPSAVALRFVPESFSNALDNIVSNMVGRLDSNNLRAFATQSIGNPVLQLLLAIEFERGGRQIAKDEQSLFRKLLPDMPPTEGSVSAKFIHGLLYDPVGSHLLETIITWSPGKIFKSIYYGQIRDNLKSIIKNDNASYVLIKALERLSAHDLQDVLEQIPPEIPSLIEHSRTSVLRALIERYHVRQLNDKEIAKAIKQHHGSSNLLDLDKIFGLFSNNPGDISRDRIVQVDENTCLSHTSLLLQKMLEYPGSLRELVNEALLVTSLGTLVKAGQDKSTTYVIQTSLSCQNQSQNFRRMLLQKFQGRASELALSNVGAYVLDAVWKATADLRFLRERIAQELARCEEALRDSHSGRIVWRTWLMDLFTKRRKSWIEKSKEIDRKESTGATKQDIPDSQRNKKTKLDMAREKFAARKAAQTRQDAKTSRRETLEQAKTSINDIPGQKTRDEGPSASEKAIGTESNGIAEIQALG